MSIVDARLLRGEVGGTTNVVSSFEPSVASTVFSSTTKSRCGSVAGVPGASLSEPDV